GASPSRYSSSISIVISALFGLGPAFPSVHAAGTTMVFTSTASTKYFLGAVFLVEVDIVDLTSVAVSVVGVCALSVEAASKPSTTAIRLSMTLLHAHLVEEQLWS